VGFPSWGAFLKLDLQARSLSFRQRPGLPRGVNVSAERGGAEVQGGSVTVAVADSGANVKRDQETHTSQCAQHAGGRLAYWLSRGNAVVVGATQCLFGGKETLLRLAVSVLPFPRHCP
jgi:hypothetical protein